MTTSEYPENDKLAAVRDQTAAIEEFLEWLTGQGVHLARYFCLTANADGTDHDCSADTCNMSAELTVHEHRSAQTLAYAFFDIDATAIEAERRQMLANLSSINQDA